jgi:DNA-binding Lrp family transcriptional regulator
VTVVTYENLDTELINALLGDGRASLRSLAEELGVSVTTVSNHLKDLEEQGVITGYSPTIDYDRLGYDVTAVIRLNVEGGALPEITDRLREQEQMISVYEVTGDHDVVAIGKFKDTDDMNEGIKDLLADADIKESNTSVVLNTVSEHEQFELDDGS